VATIGTKMLKELVRKFEKAEKDTNAEELMQKYTGNEKIFDVFSSPSCGPCG